MNVDPATKLRAPPAVITTQEPAGMLELFVVKMIYLQIPVGLKPIGRVKNVETEPLT